MLFISIKQLLIYFFLSVSHQWLDSQTIKQTHNLDQGNKTYFSPKVFGYFSIHFFLFQFSFLCLVFCLKLDFCRQMTVKIDFNHFYLSTTNRVQTMVGYWSKHRFYINFKLTEIYLKFIFIIRFIQLVYDSLFLLSWEVLL